MPYLLVSKAELTGEDLQDAQVSFDPETRAPEVAFQLDSRGAALLERLTEAHARERLAIVLDGIVVSVPVIKGRIPGGNGRITLGWGSRQDLLREAKDLALVLRAGALHAPLELVEERIMGPSLGADSIRL